MSGRQYLYCTENVTEPFVLIFQEWSRCGRLYLQLRNRGRSQLPKRRLQFGTFVPGKSGAWNLERRDERCGRKFLVLIY